MRNLRPLIVLPFVQHDANSNITATRFRSAPFCNAATTIITTTTATVTQQLNKQWNTSKPLIAWESHINQKRLYKTCYSRMVPMLRNATSVSQVFNICHVNELSQGVLAMPRRHYSPLPDNQEDFSPYVEIDLPSETRIEAIRQSGLAAQEWVACEKVHGTNFAIYLVDECEVRYAKRSGIMDPNENFFGYHVLSDEFVSYVRILCELIKQKYSIHRIGRLVLHGELFGAKYLHPLVPKSSKWCTMPNGKKFPIAGVEIQREPFPQYSPELHLYAFDIKYSVSGADEDFVLLPYDDFAELCSKVPGLIYSKPIVRGTLDECLAFDVENFQTPLPALLGLGNYPLEGNLAEGVVIRHVRRGDPAVEKHNVATIIKLRCSSFMELKHPGKQQELKETFFDTVRAGALRRVKGNNVTVIAESMLPQVEAAANNLLLNNVSEGRLSNVISKIGTEPLLNGTVTKEEVKLMFAKDALKDFLKEGDELVLNTSLTFRKALIRNVYWAACELVDNSWKEILAHEQATKAAMDSAYSVSDNNNNNIDNQDSNNINNDNDNNIGNTHDAEKPRNCAENTTDEQFQERVKAEMENVLQ